MSRRVVFVSALVLLLGVSTATQQRDGGDVLARIRAEGLQRSRALALYRTLTDEIGARLTGSSAHARAANWARDLHATNAYVWSAVSEPGADAGIARRT